MFLCSLLIFSGFDINVKDVVAMTSLPLPGYQVCAADVSEIENADRVFKVYHAMQKKVYYFLADDKATKAR